MDFDKYFSVRETLIQRGKMTPLEAVLYEYCFRFYLSTVKDNKHYYIDQLNIALFFRVSRRTVGKIIKSLEDVGLLERTGESTNSGNLCYIVHDWEKLSYSVLMDDEYQAMV
ncbi:hypothetical protein M5Y73_25845 [Citrobacter cronae]|nr:hypothetical protein [Citrobacter cronae]